MSRPLRDILGEALWLEPGILSRRSWQAWDRIAPSTTEQYRIRADGLIRVLAMLGVRLEYTATDARAAAPAASDTVWRYSLVGGRAERLVRLTEEGFRVSQIPVAGADETVQLTFTEAEAHELSGRVLTGDASAAKEQGAMTKLACLAEAHRVFAVPALPQKMEAAE